MNLNDTIEKILNSIIEDKNFFEHKHILFVGENTTGKSRTIAKIVTELFYKKKPIYYMCSWNRKIVNVRNEAIKTFKDIDYERVIKARLDSINYNKDIFHDELGTELLMNELYLNTDKYSELFDGFLSIKVSKTTIKFEKELYGIWNEEVLEINEGSFEQLSDAQVSMMRILMEVNFAFEKGCKYIFIDEFDINLDHKNSSDFLEWLKAKYTDIVFIVSAQSLYTILNLRDFDVVKIIKNFKSEIDNLCVFFDSNDLDNVDIIDKKLFASNYKISEIDERLSSNLKCILSNVPINKKDINIIEQSQKLTTRQKVVLNFIKQRARQS
ncbi:MAG: hypothetical protein F8N38_06295 [Hungatella sp.]|nr:hypothetical protein [Hungatella sp.]